MVWESSKAYRHLRKGPWLWMWRWSWEARRRWQTIAESAELGPPMQTCTSPHLQLRSTRAASPVGPPKTPELWPAIKRTKSSQIDLAVLKNSFDFSNAEQWNWPICILDTCVKSTNYRTKKKDKRRKISDHWCWSIDNVNGSCSQYFDRGA